MGGGTRLRQRVTRWGILWAACSALGLACAPSPARDVALDQPARPARVRPELVALPTPRHGHRIERLRAGWLSFGGFGDASQPDRETRQTWWLANGAKTWERRADMHTGRAFFGSACVGDVVYAVGEGLERYEPAADRWVELLPAGELPRSHFSAAAIGRTIFVLGGYGGRGADLIAIDLDGSKLRRLAAPPGFAEGDHFQIVQAIAGRLHVIGGLDGKTFEPRREHWVLGAEGWQAQAEPPPGLWAKFAVQAVVGEKLYLFGPFGGFCFDAGASTWTPRAKPEGLIVMPQTVPLDGRLWVVGGEVDGGPREPLLRCYDIAEDTWSEPSR